MLQIFRKPIGFALKSQGGLNCANLHDDCLYGIEGRFLNATNGFNLTAVDETNVTLGAAFCRVNRKVPTSRLVFSKSFACFSGGSAMSVSQKSSKIVSKQKVRCENGFATLSSGVESVTAMAATVLTLITLSVTLNPLS